MSQTLKGKLIEIMDTHVVSDRFKKREFVVETYDNPQYPQTILLQLTQEKCNVLDSYVVGEDVEVYYNIQGRKVNGDNGTKYYNSLVCWRLEKIQS